jgi:hypothetical protein
LTCILRAAVPFALSLSMCLVASGCARTYDGSIVPSYTTKMITNGVPHFEIKKTDLLPPRRLAEYPQSPVTPVAESQPARVYTPPPAREPARILPQIGDDVPRNVTCHNGVAPGGRVRVVCL